MTLKLVPKPTADEATKARVVEILRKTLEEAERGEIDCAVLILGNSNGDWTNRASGGLNYSQAIGRLEITKQEWIAQYLAEGN